MLNNIIFDNRNLRRAKTFEHAGFCKNDLLPVSIRVQATNKISVNILGAFRATVSGMCSNNEVISCNSITYVIDSATGVQSFFLSYETMLVILIINRDFPIIGSQLPNQHSKVVANLNEKDQSKLNLHEVTCSCPTRSKVPDKPCKLSLKAKSENVSKTNEWLLQRYAASTFNVCPHKPLNQMS